MTTTQLKLDMINHMAARDVTISKLWDKIGEDHDNLIRAQKDIEWYKRELDRRTNH